jgi:[protein-PII] uridylyltransferase
MSARKRAPLAAARSEEEIVRRFVHSMPTSYRGIFDLEAQRAHAAIVHRRAASATRVELWRELPERVVAICVVADDKPGLLSRISAALVAHDMDVVAAQAYCRSRDDRIVEAVDFLWVRRLAGPSGSIARVTPRSVAEIGETLDALVRGNAGRDNAVRFARAIRAVPAATRVRFDNEHGLAVLTLETRDRPGLLLSLSQTLFRERVQIVRSEVSTRDGLVSDRFFLTELDGAPLRASRLLSLQTAVLAAVEAVQRDAGADPM